MNRRYAPGLFLVALCTLAVATRAQLPDVLYLQFNEGAGVVTADTSQPGFGGAPTLSNSFGWETVTPYLGAACYSSRYPQLNSVATSCAYNTTQDFTVEFAIRIGPTSAPQIWVLSGAPFAFDIHCDLAVGSAFYSPSISSGFSGCSFGPHIPVGQWTHVSFVHHAATSTMECLIDGELVESKNLTGSLSLTGGTPWVIGRSAVPSLIYMQGELDEFRFWSYARRPGQIRLAHHQEIATGIDLGIGEVLAPALRLPRGGYYSANETLTVSIENVGASTVAVGDQLVLSVELDGSLVVSDVLTLSAPLAPGAFLAHSFAMPIDLSGFGSKTLRCGVVHAQDVSSANDNQTFVAQGGGPDVVTEYPWLESFNFLTPGVFAAPVADWLNVQGEAGAALTADWELRDGPFPGSPSSPATDYTSRVPGAGGSAFLAVDSSVVGASAWVETPVLDLTGSSLPALDFYLHHRHTGSGTPSTFAVEVESLFDGSQSLVLPPLGGSALGGWQQMRIDLSAFAGSAIIVRFKVLIGADNDVAIDDVAIVDEATQLPGQPARPGLALLQIHDALNAKRESPLSAAAGPFIANLWPGIGNVDVLFEGSPNQPVLLLRSAGLNPGIATYPGGIGQFDIGLQYDPLTGIPGNLQVLYDGFSPTTAADHLFVTDGGGQLAFSVPAFSWSAITTPYPSDSYQAVIGLPTAPWLVLSNAVRIYLW
ncbi:MAG: hypothetical protein H6807_12925 [Planctomycetes bacterium]|nr:hypothetical protein [Planctomycetota bacterium]